MTYCHGKNYLFSPVVGLLQISCSVCGPGLFLCSEAWIPDLAMSCCTAQQLDALRLRQHITGCCCCHLCRLPPTYSSSPWSDPHGSPHPCEVACAHWYGLGPLPPRSWWSCAGGRTHEWLKKKGKHTKGLGFSNKGNTAPDVISYCLFPPEYQTFPGFPRNSHQKRHRCDVSVSLSWEDRPLFP